MEHTIKFIIKHVILFHFQIPHFEWKEVESGSEMEKTKYLARKLNLVGMSWRIISLDLILY